MTYLHIITNQGLRASVRPDGKLRLEPDLLITEDVRQMVREHRDELVQEIAASVQVSIQALASIPALASGPAMSADNYCRLRDYIAQPGAAVLIGFRGAGTVVCVTPPSDMLPAGAVTLWLANGEREDYDTRMLRYPDGQPVADVGWSVVEPSTEDANTDPAQYAGQFLWVATDLDSFEDTDSRLGLEVDIDQVYRMLDAPYYAWLRSRMENARKAHGSGSLDDDAFETLRERFNIIHSWAIEHIGEDALSKAVRSTNLRTYVAPSPETYAACRKAQDDAWDAQVRQPAASAPSEALTGYAPQLQRLLATQGYAAIRSSVIGKVVVVVRDESVVVPSEWAKAVTFTMEEIGNLKGAGPEMMQQVYQVKRSFGGIAMPTSDSLARRVWPEDMPAGIPEASAGVGSTDEQAEQPAMGFAA